MLCSITGRILLLFSLSGVNGQHEWLESVSTARDTAMTEASGAGRSLLEVFVKALTGLRTCARQLWQEEMQQRSIQCRRPLDFSLNSTVRQISPPHPFSFLPATARLRS